LKSDLIEPKRNAFPQRRLLLNVFYLEITADDIDAEMSEIFAERMELAWQD